MAHDRKASSFASNERFSILLNVGISLVALLAILVMLNFLSWRHHRRYEWSRSGQQRLSPVTVGMLRTLTNDVRVTLLFDDNPNDSVHNLCAALMKEYAEASPRIQLTMVNFTRDPAAAKSLRATYSLPAQQDKNLALFEANGRSRIVFETELSDYDLSKVMKGESQEVKRNGFKGEMIFSAAILSVSESFQPKACFIQGHGEHDPTASVQVGYSELADLLRHKNFRLEMTLLTGANDIPPDCNLLIIAGPTKRFFASEVEKVERYLAAGGRLLMAFNEGSLGAGTGLERMLTTYGVSVGNNVVSDPESENRGNMILKVFMAHPITAPLQGSGMYLARPRSIGRLNMPSGPESPKVDLLASTGAQGITKSEQRNGVPYANPAVDKQGNIPVIAVAEKGGIRGVSSDKGATRMVLAGDSYFLSNGMIDSAGNRDFASLAVNWLLDRNLLLGGIGPRPIREYSILVGPAQMVRTQVLLLLILPCAVLGLGVVVWLRRRS